ncbi:MAG: hypothetical protein Q4C66_04955, partial [Lachnospiraceae bacterium]|nr:hypothetical protein [Lachnospiraceae bacterium]
MCIRRPSNTNSLGSFVRLFKREMKEYPERFYNHDKCKKITAPEVLDLVYGTLYYPDVAYLGTTKETASKVINNAINPPLFIKDKRAEFSEEKMDTTKEYVDKYILGNVKNSDQ